MDFIPRRNIQLFEDAALVIFYALNGKRHHGRNLRIGHPFDQVVYNLALYGLELRFFRFHLALFFGRKILNDASRNR